jgi:hypothetical protein
MIESAGIASNLLPIGNNPSSESQIRPFTKLEPGTTTWRSVIRRKINGPLGEWLPKVLHY